MSSSKISADATNSNNSFNSVSSVSPVDSDNPLELVTQNRDEDSQLIKKSIEGNSEAFKELFMKNVNRVHSLCLRISADIHLTEDLTQEVFIKAWEKLNTFKFECKFSTWLHSIAMNQFLMHLRSKKRENEKTVEFGKENDLQIVKQNSNDHRIDLQNAINNLPDQARAVLVLHDIGGYKHIEISKMMSIETGTSKAHLHRARKILRKELSK